MIRIGFWGPFYYAFIIGNPKNSIGNYLGSYISRFL